MHELAIASAVLEAVRVEVAARPGARVRKVGLRLGELSGVAGDALAFCFEALAKGTPLDGAALHIEVCPRRHRCRACSREFIVVDYRTACPSCADPDSECVGGSELNLDYLELEEA